MGNTESRYSDYKENNLELDEEFENLGEIFWPVSSEQSHYRHPTVTEWGNTESHYSDLNRQDT